MVSNFLTSDKREIGPYNHNPLCQEEIQQFLDPHLLLFLVVPQGLLGNLIIIRIIIIIIIIIIY